MKLDLIFPTFWSMFSGVLGIGFISMAIIDVLPTQSRFFLLFFAFVFFSEYSHELRYSEIIRRLDGGK